MPKKVEAQEKLNKGLNMTRLDVYSCTLDRQVIANKDWQNGGMRYIKIGRNIYRDDAHMTEINMLNEEDCNNWLLCGQVTKWFKIKFRIKLIM